MSYPGISRVGRRIEEGQALQRVIGIKEAVFDALFTVLDRTVFKRQLRKVESSGTTRVEQGLTGFIEPQVGCNLGERDAKGILGGLCD